MRSRASLGTLVALAALGMINDSPNAELLPLDMPYQPPPLRPPWAGSAARGDFMGVSGKALEAKKAARKRQRKARRNNR